ncbi:hypothetical protein SAMN06265338_108154 [Rhodoblastus acidophilus]|uniref:Uncharacterized protein n=1 Tax=Rhodoblastus acidophilus TaxID=1074 RepID=A0A212RXU1_RHOAC|nr:hypothetical protein [Rhodoblastus acidophilus]PPQ38443.1 hypothetical protein CKO16_10695 [Rhodoblastus acidophilus]RAI17251.1 hypothetical protein CH337_17130 [Rhodoblastus acidophilus]SNB77541.1 hypothetical protein SAMN06265338_108154 [Rhodoblastus acidophilus]
MTDQPPVTIPSFGFARGAVVRQGDGPNMIVVRSYGEHTACVFCAGDKSGTLHLKEFESRSLRLILPAVTPLDEVGE